MLSRILTIGLLGLMFCTTACSSTAPHPKGYETYVAKGDKFKDMTLTSIQGDTVSFDQNKKKLIVLFATWCSDSKRTLRELKASPLISDPTLEIIAINEKNQRRASLNLKTVLVYHSRSLPIQTKRFIPITPIKGYLDSFYSMSRIA
ncbi:TlpA family protein disulfide reductase [Pseudoalteromonas xiamenensis]